MAYAYVKTTKNAANSNALSFTCTTGNLLVLHVATSAGAGAPTVTAVSDNNAVAWSSGVATFNDGDNYFQTVYYLQNAEAGITSVTVTFNGGTPGQTEMWVDEYSGLATSAALVVAQGHGVAAPGTTTDGITSGTAVSVGTVPALIYGVAYDPGGAQAISVGTGFTSRYSAGNRRVEDKRVTSTGSYNATFTATVGTDKFGAFMLAFAEPGVTPTLTAAGVANAFTATATGVSITGTNLGANTAARTLSLIQGSTTVAQTQQSGNATSGTFDVVFDSVSPSIKYGAATLRAVVSAVNADLAVTITAPTGKSYVDLTTPNATAGNRITAVADLVSGDQLEISNVQGGLITDVNVNADATFDVASAVTAFDVRVWSTADSTWGAVATQTIGAAASTGIVLVDTEVVNAVVARLGSFGLKTNGTLVQIL